MGGAVVVERVVRTAKAVKERRTMPRRGRRRACGICLWSAWVEGTEMR